MFAPRMQYRDGRPNDPMNMLAVGEIYTPPSLRRVVGETPRAPFTPVPRPEAYMDMGSRTPTPPSLRREVVGLPQRKNFTYVPRPGAYTDRRARPPISVRPVARPQPFQPQPFQPQPFQPQPAPPQFGQVEEQPQFNQQGMQQMMQMMQQMMQMISQFSNQGGFGGGFGGGYGGGMGGGFGRGYESMGGPFGQMMRPRPRPMFDYFSQNPFTRY